MLGIDLEMITHKLNIDPSFKPVRQKRIYFTLERNQTLNEEIDKLQENGMVKEVQYPDWLVSYVVINKKNGENKVCIDFID